MADTTALILQATATIEGATKELIPADGILSSDVPVGKQYVEEVRNWLLVGDTAILIAERTPEPKQDSKGVIETFKSAVDAYNAVAQEVRKKLNQHMMMNESTAVDVDYPMDMPSATAPPPSYDDVGKSATGGPAVTAPLVPKPKNACKHVVVGVKVRAKKQVKAPIKWRWTLLRIFTLAAVVLINVLFICILVDLRNVQKKGTPCPTMSPEEFSRMHNEELLTRYLAAVNEKIYNEKMDKDPAPTEDYDDDGVPASAS